jgi:predicted MPP superfamily phosphohydrolase
MTEIKKLSRRQFLKKAGFTVFGLGMMGTVYTSVERFWYQTNEVHLKIKNLPEAFKGWKIVQFSDTHFGFHYGGESFRRVVRMINDLNPDILFFTGDLLDRQWLETPSPSVLPALQELKVPRGGKWAVLGNHDYALKDQVVEMLQSSNFRVLINSHDYIESKGQHLCIAGVDEYMFGQFDIKKTLLGKSDQDCVLLLAHEPDLADICCTFNVNAQFSGHSHGGQIRKPFSKPIFTPELGQKYVSGLYSIGDNEMPLYVNRGIGTSYLPIRLFCRPEITVFYIS